MALCGSELMSPRSLATPRSWWCFAVVLLYYYPSRSPAHRLRSGKESYEGDDIDVSEYLLVVLTYYAY